MWFWILLVLFCGLLLVCVIMLIFGYFEEVLVFNLCVVYKIVVVLDGIGNDFVIQINVVCFYELVVNQNCCNILIFYIEGVGSDGWVIGMLMGWGIGKDVCDVYCFIVENWMFGLQIYIVGFSCGVYVGCVLFGLIYIVGIVCLCLGMLFELFKGIVDRFYDVYKMMLGKGEILIGWEMWWSKCVVLVFVVNDFVFILIMICVVVYWDMVEVFGVFDWMDDFFNEGGLVYLDQLCNVEWVFYVVVFDDNCVFSYMLIFMIGDKMIEFCFD